jgi:hypothetical protein
MSNRYLEILELNPGATKEEVKRSYRRLSKIYHPDISKSDDAKERFIEINEAYNFLISVGPSPNAEPVSYNYNPEVEAYKAWRREARARARKRAADAEMLQQEMIKKILTGFKTFFIIILTFNVLLTIDYILPTTKHQEKIIAKTRIYEPAGKGFQVPKNHRYDELIFGNFKMRFDRNEIMMINMAEDAEVMATPIFNKPISVKVVVEDKPMIFEQYYNIYKTFGILIPLVLGSMYFYTYKTESLDYKLTLALFIAIIFIIQSVIFISY